MQSRTSSVANQMKHRDREMVPKVLVRAMFGLMAASILFVAYARFADVPLSGVVADSAIVQERVITLTGDRVGGFAIRDESGAVLAHSQDAKNGFIAVIAASVERERATKGVSTNEPLRLVRRENERVAIIDPASDWQIELIGYGADNVAAFAKLLN